MSKRKPATASKGARNAKMAARPRRNKQAVVRSPKDNVLRSVEIEAIESPLTLHEDSGQEPPIVENPVGILQDDLSQKIRDSNPKHGFALATTNLQAYQAKLLEIAEANTKFALEFGLRLAAIKSPFEFFAVVLEFTGRRIDMFGQHSKELAAYPFSRIEASRELTALPGR